MKFILDDEKFAKTEAIRIARDKGIKVGNDCRFFTTSFSSESFLIEIGNHVTITEGVRFVTHDGGMWVIRELNPVYKKSNILGRIKIGNNVFIGLNSIILPGVSIGDNTIIAAGSVVTKSFNGNCVIGGVPAKKIRDIDEYIDKNKKFFIETIGLKRDDIISILEENKKALKKK
jgi:acetyltransferase-like isoleucine patch superfamily enzyme